MPITGFNELVEELKLMREQFKEQQERQVAEQRKRQQLEMYRRATASIINGTTETTAVRNVRRRVAKQTW